MERVDGTQARLKQRMRIKFKYSICVERVDGTQARLKQAGKHSTHRPEAMVERVDGTQARLKQLVNAIRQGKLVQSGKGGWDSGEIETRLEIGIMATDRWKGWMGLRRD